MDDKPPRTTNNISSRFSASFSKALSDLSEQLKHFPENNKKTKEIENDYAYLLSTYGWYISPIMKYKDVFEIFIDIQNLNIKKAEGILLKYYRKEINNIKKNLIENYPERKNVISEAFKAHKQKMYFSSTILFLSQADGIGDGKIFRGKKPLKEYLSKGKNFELLDTILPKETAINEDTRKIKSNFFSDLNRHGVMHGLHTNYGNKKNSFKALSLLCFISDSVNF